MSLPDYDSGWIAISCGQSKTFTHNLGTDDTFVYIEKKLPDSLTAAPYYRGGV